MYRDCIIGRYIAKEFILDLNEELKLYIDVVKTYSQNDKNCDVYYAVDNTTERYKYVQFIPHLKLFESW